jgi:hypothetical protein
LVMYPSRPIRGVFVRDGAHLWRRRAEIDRRR